jgi:hypothetical protein
MLGVIDRSNAMSNLYEYSQRNLHRNVRLRSDEHNCWKIRLARTSAPAGIVVTGSYVALRGRKQVLLTMSWMRTATKPW